ncbi:Hypothetical protein POVN_LOCUS382 [uncultured virus]|nr:Hypothetical protein POVN_LOCUS382 [uncultured virus]
MAASELKQLETGLRFMLQIAGNKDATKLAVDQQRLLEELRTRLTSQESAAATLTMVNRILLDLGLDSAHYRTKPGTVVDTVKRVSTGGSITVEAPVEHKVERKVPRLPIAAECRLDSDSDFTRCDRYVIWYECADRCLPPVFISSPTRVPGGLPNDEAFVYVDTTIFPGLETTHYRSLYDAGIRKVHIVYYNAEENTYEPLTVGLVDINSVRQHASSTAVRPAGMGSEARNAFALAFILVLVIVVGHKVFRFNG